MPPPAERKSASGIGFVGIVANIPRRMHVAGTSEVTEQSLTRWLRHSVLFFFLGLSVALAVWSLSHWELLEPYVVHNQIEPSQRNQLLWLCLVGGVGFAVVGAAFGLGFGLTAMDAAASRMGPLVLVGLLPGLFHYRMWVGRDVLFLTSVLLVGMSFLVLIADPLSRGLYPDVVGLMKTRLLRGRSVPGWVAPILVGCLSLGYAVYFSIATIQNHHNFGTSAFDLGIETNLVWNTLHGGPLFRSAPLGGNMMHGGYHQTYFAFVLAPFFALWPRAETLLIIQATFLGAAAIPLFLLLRSKVGVLPGLVVCACFLLYGPLHGANLYDFHYQPFGVFFTLLLAYLIESGRGWSILLPVALLMLSVREDMGAMMGALGGFYLFSGKRPKDALILALMGTAYVLVMKLYVMPHLFLKGRSSFTFIYRLLLPEGESSFGGVLKTLFANPLFALSTILTPEKLSYALQIFVPLVLLPLRRSVALLLFLPGCLLTLLSTAYPAAVMTSFQYTSYWAPMAFLSLGYALRDQRARSHPRMQAWICAICLATVLTSTRFGAVFQVETARGAFDPVHLRPTPEGREMMRDFRALALKIPKDAKVASSEWLISHLAARKDAYALRNGVLDAEYLLFWLHPTKFRGDERPVLMDVLFRNPRYEVVERRGMFVLAQAKAGMKRPSDPGLRRELQKAGTGVQPVKPKK